MIGEIRMKKKLWFEVWPSAGLWVYTGGKQEGLCGLWQTLPLSSSYTFICWVRWDDKILYAPEEMASITQIWIIRIVMFFFDPCLYQSPKTNQVMQIMMSPIRPYNSVLAILNLSLMLEFLPLCSLIIISICYQDFLHMRKFIWKVFLSYSEIDSLRCAIPWSPPYKGDSSLLLLLYLKEK